ncbi:MAG: signal peptidase I [bacterium]
MGEQIEQSEKTSQESFKIKLARKLAEAGVFFLELVKIVVLAAITIVLIRHFLFKPFYVRGASMETNFYDKEYLIIDELSYRFREPARGEVIVFKYPEDPKEYFLKRIIGLPGERIKISNGKVVIYNQEYPEGTALDEIYLDDEIFTDGEKVVSLNKDEYFVLGDNRPNSYDSRRFGAIQKNVMVGRVIFRGWPFNRVQIINSPELSV